jgi:ribonuclease J
MISEGTRIGTDEDCFREGDNVIKNNNCRSQENEGPYLKTEKELKEHISHLINKTGGLVLVEHPIRDTDRVLSIYEAAKENGRRLVVPMKLAYLIEKLEGICPISIEDVDIHIPPKSWGLIYKTDIDARQLKQDYAPWERKYLDHKNIVTSKQISKSQSNYVVSMNLWEINQLIDIRPSDAIWIKSSCEPFCEEMEIDEERKNNWLEHFKIKKEFAHTSGHASARQINEMILSINPDILIPVHTERPDLFPKL